jgi:hypothetical protein
MKSTIDTKNPTSREKDIAQFRRILSITRCPNVRLVLGKDRRKLPEAVRISVIILMATYATMKTFLKIPYTSR